MPSSLKRKSNPEAPHAPSKRLRTDGLFTPRVKTPTGASRSIPRASRYQPSLTSPAKRTLDEEYVEGLGSKVRILNNRECLHLLPSRKPLPVPALVLQRKIKPRSPLKNAIIARLSRRRAILLQRQKLERIMERMDSDNVYYFSEGLSDGIKLFTSRSPASFSSFSIEIPDLEMEVEEPTDCATATASGGPSQPASDPKSPVEEIVKTNAHEGGGGKKSGDVDEGLVQEPKPKPEGRKEKEKDAMGGAEADPEEEKDLMRDDEGEEKEDKREASDTLSTKDKLVNGRIKERLGEDGMICLNVKTKRAEEGESTAAKKSPIKKRAKVVLPPTLEEDEDEEEKEPESPKKRNSRSSSPQKKGGEADDSSDSERGDREEKSRRRSPRSRVRKSEGEEKEEKEEEEKEPESPGKKVSQPKPKHEDSNLLDTDEDDDRQKQEEGGEATAHVDKMEEDAEADAESTGSSGEDTDMSTDDEAPTETIESTGEEDVAMSEDGDGSDDSRNTLSVGRGEEERQEKEDEVDNKDNEESSTPIKTDFKISDEEAKKPKRVKALVLSSQAEEVEAISTPKAPSSAATLRYNFSITKTPKSPRSPRLFKHDLVPSSPLGFSGGFSKKKKTLLKPEIERDASLWMLGKSSSLHPKRRRQRPFIPANVSRHAYRDSDSDDGEDMYTHHHHGFQSSRRENDETEDEDVYLRMDWPWDGRGLYNSWMMEHGGPLLELCVRGLEGFNMAW